MKTFISISEYFPLYQITNIKYLSSEIELTEKEYEFIEKTMSDFEVVQKLLGDKIKHKLKYTM
jgi:hypothetical protein